ncbi:hypothetical protein ACQ9BO_10590 [Flavobacterium sp. P21]|uniref:hypothetical protein n=1 Tax=Flavobacterium sp. P21 TaxID=3423948 RepID=UPI003D67CFD3
MKTEFNEIYENLFADYQYDFEFGRRNYLREINRRQYSEFDFIRIIRRAIDRSDKELLRADAKYFLLVNFHHLVVLPVLENNLFRNREYEINLYEFQKSIEADIEIIIQTSFAENKIENTTEGFISGHQIMITIDSLWKKLSTTAFDIWG